MLNNEVNDKVFGIMTYKHRWIKKEKINFWNHSYELTIAAKAYSNKPITDEQRKSYEYFKKNISTLSEETAKKLCNYINIDIEELDIKGINKKRVEAIEDLNNIVFPKTILFKQDGEIIILCDYIFDEENGLGIKVYPSLKIGTQDLFL